MRRAVRVGGVGLLLGLAVSFAVVGRAQRVDSVPVPLVVALQAAGLAADVNVVVAGVPALDVYLPVTADDWRRVLLGLAVAHDLTVCDLGPDTVLVSGSERGLLVCGPVASPVDEAAEDGAAVEEPLAASVEVLPAEAVEVLPVGLAYRVRVLQLDETRARELGIDWAGGVFETAARLVAGGVAISSGMIPVAEMKDVVRFLESEGVALRLDEVELRAESGEAVSFNRGGTISVNLVGGGNAAISDRYQYGLGLELRGVVDGDEVWLNYSFSDSAPSNVSDPSNVQLASTTSRSSLRVTCGSSVVVAAVGSSREGWQGSGLPAASSMPVVGYAFGSSAAVRGQTSVVVTVDVGCLS